ncbi:hypothetical protein E2C01_067724 [Portunus trituberculatus]|uniref:Uncharacterized protein n=1 Tax=Portunus trituberculatus TaxID=210409 RepID=A0A5B7HVV4_PORTR|nr:hypothetical protein [Portunus trituberculatus]
MLEIDPSDAAVADFTFSTNITLSLPDLLVGIHDLTLNLSNEVSVITFSVTVDIREPIQDITIAISIVVEEGKDPVPALEFNGNLVLPALVPIMFTPSAGKGIPSYWGLFDENDQEMNMTETKDQSLYYMFSDDAIRNITVKAYAEAEGWVAADSLLIFQVTNKIQGLSVTDFNIITPAVST